MTSLPIMKKALIPRVVGNVVVECGVPSLSPCSFTRLPLDSTHQATQDRLTPPRSHYINRGGTTLFYFCQDDRIDRLVRSGHAIDPENQPSQLHKVGYSRF